MQRRALLRDAFSLERTSSSCEGPLVESRPLPSMCLATRNGKLRIEGEQEHRDEDTRAEGSASTRSNGTIPKLFQPPSHMSIQIKQSQCVSNCRIPDQNKPRRRLLPAPLRQLAIPSPQRIVKLLHHRKAVLHQQLLQHSRCDPAIRRRACKSLGAHEDRRRRGRLRRSDLLERAEGKEGVQGAVVVAGEGEGGSGSGESAADWKEGVSEERGARSGEGVPKPPMIPVTDPTTSGIEGAAAVSVVSAAAEVESGRSETALHEAG